MALIRSLLESLRASLSISRERVADDLVVAPELLTRFITESRHFKKDRALPRAFEPKYEDDRGRFETSGFRTLGLANHAIWEIGAREVEPTRRKPVLARAEIDIEHVLLNDLAVIRDEPPHRHAVIVGWPDGDEDKPRRKSIQQELASHARLFLKD